MLTKWNISQMYTDPLNFSFVLTKLDFLLEFSLMNHLSHMLRITSPTSLRKITNLIQILSILFSPVTLLSQPTLTRWLNMLRSSSKIPNHQTLLFFHSLSPILPDLLTPPNQLHKSQLLNLKLLSKQHQTYAHHPLLLLLRTLKFLQYLQILIPLNHQPHKE